MPSKPARNARSKLVRRPGWRPPAKPRAPQLGIVLAIAEDDVLIAMVADLRRQGLRVTKTEVARAILVEELVRWSARHDPAPPAGDGLLT
jgi:hypothetical protein